MKSHIMGLAASVATIALTGGTAIAQAPMPWTGPYVGVSVGYVGSSMHVDDRFGNLPPYTEPESFTQSTSGGIGGVQAGFNWQLGHFVLGAEGDFSGSGASSTSTVPSAGDTRILHAQLTELATLRGRLGFAFDSMPLMIFATGGVAFANLTDNATDFHALGEFDEWHKQGWRTGWTAGGGGEWMFARNWSLKAEVLYVDFGNTTIQLPHAPSACREGFSDTAVVARAGVNFHF